jgi:hypothetical protein
MQWSPVLNWYPGVLVRGESAQEELRKEVGNIRLIMFVHKPLETLNLWFHLGLYESKGLMM